MRADERQGTRLGDRTLVRVIGAGGMATVYEAVHRNGHRVAVKMLHAALAASEGSRRRFRRESYVVNRIQHDAVVRIFDDGEAPDGTPYLVLELLRGASVGSLLREQGRLPLEQAIRLIDQLLGVLVSAHAAGVVHRDLKPDNLFVLEDGRLKVLDFGIARMFEEIEGVTVHTQHGAVLGTPAFMAQEQARGRWSEVGERTDLWAAAATLFTMLAGEPVHAGGTPNEQLGRAMTMPARSLRSARPDLPAALIQFVDRALEFEPAQRWPSAAVMRAALRAACPDICAFEPIEPGTQSAPRAPAEPTRSSAPTTVSEIRSLHEAAAAATPRGATRSMKRAIGLALFAVLATVFALTLTRAPSRAPANAGHGPARPPADEPIRASASLAPQSVTIAPTAELAPRPVSPELAKPPSHDAEVAASAASSVTARRPTPAARGRMIQGAPRADADRRSPPSHVAPPPNLFELRH